MKKLLSAVLALVMVLALAPAAFAAGDAPRKPVSGVIEAEMVSPNLAGCTGDRVRVRDGAWGKVLGRLYKGDQVEVGPLKGTGPR